MFNDLQNIVVKGRKVDPEELYRLASWAMFGPKISQRQRVAIFRFWGSEEDAIHEVVLYFLFYCSEESARTVSLGTLVPHCVPWAMSRRKRDEGKHAKICERLVAKKEFRDTEDPPSEFFDDIPLADRIEPFLSRLTDPEQRVIRERFLNGKTLRQIAVDMKVSWQRISQIAAKALGKLADVITTSGQKEVLLSYLE